MHTCEWVFSVETENKVLGMRKNFCCCTIILNANAVLPIFAFLPCFMNLPSKFGAVYKKNRILFQGMLDNSLDFKCYEISLFENRKNRVVRKVSYNNEYLLDYFQPISHMNRGRPERNRRQYNKYKAPIPVSLNILKSVTSCRKQCTQELKKI